VVGGRHHHQPVARDLLAGAADQGGAVGGQILADIKAVAARGRPGQREHQGEGETESGERHGRGSSPANPGEVQATCSLPELGQLALEALDLLSGPLDA
jgi:hypothetical protein